MSRTQGRKLISMEDHVKATARAECRKDTDVVDESPAAHKPIEQVAERLARDVRDYIGSGAHVGPHLADQLLLPMALAGSGEFITTAPTEHLTTNAALVEKFLPVEIEWVRADDRRWRVVVRS